MVPLHRLRLLCLPDVRDAPDRAADLTVAGSILIDRTEWTVVQLAVVILKAHHLKVCFPGDMETSGWKSLLKKPGFEDAIRDVNVFVASHHGRQNGCSQELFDETGMKPVVTIISDSGKQYASQETVNWYAARSSGMDLYGNLRKVITTRYDGRILIQATAQGTTLDVGA